ncbi:mucin-like protein [Pomacea canaliculata]|uniref:mucin-like protein n=1 Tax=Pomacea canaliculata TaxID=400727 RepID=UPI000D73A150|nr:mucin-like protein [Pomacea canaliculata]
MDMLITSRPFAGASLAYNPLIFEQTDLYETEDRLAHVACCLNSPDRFCRRFYQLRPVGDCDPNPALGWSPLYGDPHVTALDGRQYIFNGLGEFTMATVRTAHVSFTLQARTQRAELRPGTPTNGTVFTAVGAEENGVRVFLQIDPNTNTTLILFANNIDYTRQLQQEGDNFVLDHEGVMIVQDNNTCVVTFPSGIGLQISVSMKALAIGVSFPTMFRNMTKGLLGNFNGDNTDDFVLPGGQVLRNNLTEKQILSMFCLQWAVDNSSTVMRYEARMGPKDYNHPEFQPVFLDELDALVRREAEGLCGTKNLPCIYDFLATGNKDFALSTADQQKLSDDLMKQSKNSLPSVKVPAAAYVSVGVQKTVFINGSDPDVNDRLTYRIVDDAKGAVNINSSSGAITIFLKTLDPIKIQVYVVDEVGGQSTVESLPLVVCSGCEGHGLCNESDPRDVSGDSYFQYAVCQCQPAWTGNNCELDKDGCSDNPCHPLQTCADVPASQQGSSDVGYRCSDCPPGFSSRNGSQDCIDIDECGNSSLHKCDMKCHNTYGGYECSCQEGFRLSTDGRTCADVNECLESTHDCRQVCNNTEGGYLCECEPGYSYDEITKDCIMDSSLSGVCQASGCSQGCSVATDPSSSSSIPLCFCYQGYDLDPRDNATCVDRDECRDKVCDQVCNNTAGGFSCSCYDGFALNKDERTCSACPYLKYGPECRETCTCSGRSVACHPVRGCVCQDGWTGKSCEEDVDECAENPDVCGTQKRCVNNKGSYSCVCRPGYATTDDGVCQDINECSTSNPCSEQEDCTNIPGGFYCTCKVGYIKIGSNCTDIDECKLNISDCQQECVNVPGYFNCDCKYGYRLTADRDIVLKFKRSVPMELCVDKPTVVHLTTRTTQSASAIVDIISLPLTTPA